jgi:translation initiation factor IF-2
MDRESSAHKVQQILAGLMDLGVVVESLGGDTQVALVSAKTGAGVPDLLEKIILQVGGLAYFYVLYCA